MRKALFGFVCVTFAGAAFGQSLRPILVVKVKGDKGEKSERLAVSAVKVDARILGTLAETRMTLTFHNPHDRVLAGDLYFPLPEGATVSGYALDIRGEMIDGVVVEKQKARQVYEKIVRQGIDPGLVEWVKGNRFKTRVFPMPAKGRRTVMVKYVSDLVGGRGGTAYRLPLAFPGKVADFKLRVEVVDPAAAPTVTGRAPANFEFRKWRRSYVAETVLRDVALNKDLVIAVPETRKAKALVEKGPDDEYYFCVHDVPDQLAVEPGLPPKRIAILWDASGSRAGADHQREIALLRAWFAGLRAKEIEVDLVTFRNAPARPERFVIRNGNADGLAGRLRSIRYDGGTQMGTLAAPAKADLCLLFTDGLSNFGSEEPGAFKAPVYVISSGSTANHPFLHHLAERSGGQYFNLSRLDDKTVAAAIGHSPHSFISAAVSGGEVAETYPRAGRPVHGRFTLTGRLVGKKAQVTLNYGVRGRVSGRTTYTVSRDAAVEGDLLRRYWAQKKVQDLQARPKRNAKEITRIGRKYGIVTPGTSLIVLDSLDQYVEHRIRPPKSLPKMRAKWEDLMEKRGRAREKDEKAKLDRIVALWKNRVKWWETEFTYPKDFKYRAPKGKKNGGRAPGAEGEPRPAAERRPALTPARQAPRGGTGRLMMAYAPGQTAKADDPGRAAEPGIAIKPWDPKTPYLAALRAAPADKGFEVYMKQRAKFGTSPAFFLDCADFFRKQKRSGLTLQVLSNVAEMELENPALLRILAHRLAQLGRLDLSAALFEEVLRIRPEEPQSYRDLALVLAQQKKYERAITLLYKVVLETWNRFGEIELIALMELNTLIPRARAAGIKDIPVDPRLVKLLDCDVRIILTWDADLTDMDLWVIEPSSEKAFYGHRRTTIGGTFSRDFTQGYGPEEYLLRKAMTGPYKIQTNYYGSSAPKLAGAVTLQLDVFTNYGRPNEKRKSITLRLTKKKEILTVGEIEF